MQVDFNALVHDDKLFAGEPHVLKEVFRNEETHRTNMSLVVIRKTS